MKYKIDYHTGAGNFYSNDFEKAKKLADEGLCYTQENVSISDNEKVLAERHWIGCLDGLGECFDAIRFGDLGYYADWVIY